MMSLISVPAAIKSPTAKPNDITIGEKTYTAMARRGCERGWMEKAGGSRDEVLKVVAVLTW